MDFVLYNSIPINITKTAITKLKNININFSWKEIIEIYLPLSRLLNSFYISSKLIQQTVVKLNNQKIFNQFININQQRIPYIIGITGSVAAGKSTIARILQILLSCWPEHRTVELVTTDGFLHPNSILQQRNIMNKKGFPESYDIPNLINFVYKIKLGIPRISIPIYSHVSYDIIPNKTQIITQPDILILEGLNVLHIDKFYQNKLHHLMVSNFIDFSIYIDVPENFLKNWYINRFLKFRQHASSDPTSYFYYYSQLSELETIKIANYLWLKINQRNLQENILPTRRHAKLILGKSFNHSIEKFKLRKIHYII